MKSSVEKMNKRRTKPLNLEDPMVQEISKRYNLAPKVVAYLRSAMVEGHYTRQTLIAHIEFDNDRRRKAIEYHKVRTDIPATRKAELIKYTEINIKFREGVLQTLRTCDYSFLSSILKKKGIRYNSK